MPDRSPEDVVAALAKAFRGQDHDMLVRGQINASPDRHGRVRQLLAKAPDGLSLADLDWLVFKALYTVGDVATFKFALVRFLQMVLRDQGLGGGLATDSYVILPKLEQSNFDSWPRAERDALLDALALWADKRHERALHELGPDEEAQEITEWVKARR